MTYNIKICFRQYNAQGSLTEWDPLLLCDLWLVTKYNKDEMYLQSDSLSHGIEVCFTKNCWETEVFSYLFSSPYVTRQHVRPVQRSIKILAVEELGGNNELQQKVQLRTRKNVIYVKAKLKKSRMLNRFAFLLWV